MVKVKCQQNLGRTALTQAFSQQYYDGKFAAILLDQVRSQNDVTAFYLRLARLHGKTKVLVTIDPKILLQVAEFLKTILKTVAQHVAESQYQQITGLIDTARGVVKNVNESAVTMGGGAADTVTGFWDGNTNAIGTPRFQKGWDRFFKGLTEIGLGYAKLNFQTPLDATLMAGLKSVSSFQSLLGLEGIGRLLTQNEIKILTQVFASSVEYGAVRIKEGYSGALHLGKDVDAQGNSTYLWNTRAITIGNTIYMKHTPAADWNRVLVHEATHVWQHQNGGTDYMLEALHAQEFGEGYAFDPYIGSTKTPRSWRQLNPEQQAYLIDQAYVAGFFTINPGQWMQPVPGSNNKIRRPDLATYMKNVVPQLLAGQGAT